MERSNQFNGLPEPEAPAPGSTHEWLGRVAAAVEGVTCRPDELDALGALARANSSPEQEVLITALISSEIARARMSGYGLISAPEAVIELLCKLADAGTAAPWQRVESANVIQLNASDLEGPVSFPDAAAM